uniref:Uncharacterized protein n=1 Tax=Ciona savignyi TaxID=51511 RepID=H2YXK4_CIOSA
MDMDPAFHEPDGRVRSNISPNKWKHSDLPPFPMYPNRETRGPPFDPPRHGLDVRRVCHEPRRPLEHELPYFHSHHRQVEAYPPNEPFYQPPTPPLARSPPLTRSPPPDFRERPRYPDSIMQHFEKLPAHDLRHQAGYRNYNRPSSSHHYTNYRATSPVRAMPRRRSPYENERRERERDYDHSRRSRGRKRNTRSRVSNDNDNDIEYESFDRLLQKYKSIQKDVLPNLSEIEVKREKQIAHAIHNRIAVMQPNNSNESSSKSRETEKTSSEVETVEIDGKRIPISLIQDALRNVFQQAAITGL